MSGLRARLERLHREYGSEAGASAGASDLRQRLARLRGAGRARTPRARAARIGDGALAERLGGRVVSGGLIAVEQTLPLDTRHGRARLDGDLAPALHLFAAAGAPASPCAARDALFMDTETTGLSGGTGTLVFLLGLARRSANALELTQLFLTGFEGEPAMLETAARFAAQARVLVTYNGKSFDQPLLCARYRLLGRADPFAPLAHVDLLHATRRAFGKRWRECSLRTLERHLLAFQREGDIASAEVPAAWVRWMRHGETADLIRVLRHNRWDLVSLAGALPLLRRCYEAPAEGGADALALARHYGRRFDEDRAYAYLRAHRQDLTSEGLLELARLSRRRGDWALALSIWSRLAAHGDARALEHLAKYHEHVARDPERALASTRELIAREPDAAAHRRRAARLRAKLHTGRGRRRERSIRALLARGAAHADEERALEGAD